MTLQFRAAGYQNPISEKRKKLMVGQSPMSVNAVIPEEEESKSLTDDAFLSDIAAALSDDEFHDGKKTKNGKTSLKKAGDKKLAKKKPNEGQSLQHTKDLQLSIFHALGKFLYNKRINPKTKKPE